MKSIKLNSIRTDGGTQMRVALSSEVYFDYRDKWQAGVKFDPVDVFFDGATYWLADGFHRFFGAREAKRKEIPCRVHRGTQRDAILFSVGANTEHGLRRTNADKRKAVESLLADVEWVKWSDRKIAEAAAVSNAFVTGVRHELLTVNSCEDRQATQRTGRDGKKRRHLRRQAPTEPTESDDQQDDTDAPTQSQPNETADGDRYAQFQELWSECNKQQKLAIRAFVLAEDIE
jgi:ParB-like chromosome segregation protein Spo0J